MQKICLKSQSGDVLTGLYSLTSTSCQSLRTHTSAFAIFEDSVALIKTVVNTVPLAILDVDCHDVIETQS